MVLMDSANSRRHALAKRLFAIFDTMRGNNLPLADFSDPRSDWYLNATAQDHVEREERMWSPRAAGTGP